MPKARRPIGKEFIVRVTMYRQILTSILKLLCTPAHIMIHLALFCIVLCNFCQFIVPCLHKMQFQFTAIRRSHRFTPKIVFSYHSGHLFGGFKSGCFSIRLLISQFVVCIEEQLLQLKRHVNEFGIVRATWIECLFSTHKKKQWFGKLSLGRWKMNFELFSLRSFNKMKSNFSKIRSKIDHHYSNSHHFFQH